MIMLMRKSTMKPYYELKNNDGSLMILKCVIIDDEPLALRLLEGFVDRVPFLHHIASYMDPLTALDQLTDDVQIIFLDIQMPGLTGLEFSKLITTEARIIFTTAYRKYAFESYEVQALDYLLKPITYTTFLKAVTRAKTYFDKINKTINQLQKDERVIELPKPETQCNAYFFVKSDYKLIRVDFEDILYISGLKDYVRIYIKSSSRPIIALTTMKNINDKLPKENFMRVHRSYIIAINKIDNIERNRIRIGSELIPIAEINLKELLERVK